MCPAAFFFSAAGQWWAFLGGTLLVCVWRLGEQFHPLLRSTARALGRDILSAVVVETYVIFLGTFAVLLLAQPGGQWWTLALFILVVATDTGAYVTGLVWGRRLLAPSISPKKTWEGFIGSLVSGLIAGILLAVFMLGQPWWFGLIFGGILVGTATLGDLSESLIKRDLGVKDMSSWLPGHGGFLDRFDSILPSAAAAYALFLLFA